MSQKVARMCLASNGARVDNSAVQTGIQKVPKRDFALHFRLGNQFGKGDFKRLGESIGRIQTLIALTIFNLADVDLMQPGLFHEDIR